jgi:4-carboxymuconolactone decarboxylase
VLLLLPVLPPVLQLLPWCPLLLRYGFKLRDYVGGSPPRSIAKSRSCFIDFFDAAAVIISLRRDKGSYTFRPLTGNAMSQTRMPAIPEDNYTEAQKEAALAFLETRKTPVFGPFAALMRSPELMTHAQAMGEYLRYRSAIGARLSELAILITAREWTQDYEWYVHRPQALKAGLKPEIVEAVFEGRRPAGMAPDEEALYDFTAELNRTKRVSDTAYERAVKQFGEQGVIDIIGILGYYSLLAMTLNVARSRRRTAHSACRASRTKYS